MACLWGLLSFVLSPLIIGGYRVLAIGLLSSFDSAGSHVSGLAEMGLPYFVRFRFPRATIGICSKQDFRDSVASRADNRDDIALRVILLRPSLEDDFIHGSICC